ncbi:MAG: NAD(P)/FAD-dependent oxidoreductase [Firmicutes bacterium]|nr:NAD(P)/FAD-dependent oxidoreductase [Bacillota bacterium]
MNKADIAIIGTGPGGVSAAITAAQRGKSVLLFGSAELSPKMAKAEKIMNYPGFPSVKGADLAAALKAHLKDMNISVTEDKVTQVYDMGGKFTLQGASSAMYDAEALIIATGVVPTKLYAGEKELLGAGVSYCATCDAPLHRGKPVAVIADSPEEEGEVKYLSEVAEHVYFFPLYKDKPDMGGNISVLAEIPKEISAPTFSSRLLKTDKGEYDVSCVFILRRAIAADQLLPQLATENGHIVVDRQMCTNVKGVFACGDITGRPYQYVKAAGEGNVAALSAVEYISQKNDK